jgi:hypothetical protein
MEYVIVFALGMIAATLLIRWMARQAIERVLGQLDKDIEQTALDTQLSVDLEVEQNIYFLYNSDDKTFVAQGRDVMELFLNVKQRFPNRIVKIVKGEPEAMKRLQDQLKELNENSNRVGSTS